MYTFCSRHVFVKWRGETIMTDWILECGGLHSVNECTAILTSFHSFLRQTFYPIISWINCTKCENCGTKQTQIFAWNILKCTQLKLLLRSILSGHDKLQAKCSQICSEICPIFWFTKRDVFIFRDCTIHTLSLWSIILFILSVYNQTFYLYSELIINHTIHTLSL